MHRAGATPFHGARGGCDAARRRSGGPARSASRGRRSRSRSASSSRRSRCRPLIACLPVAGPLRARAAVPAAARAGLGCVRGDGDRALPAGRGRAGVRPTRRRLAAVVVAPLTEEAAKGLFILLLLWFRRARARRDPRRHRLRRAWWASASPSPRTSSTSPAPTSAQDGQAGRYRRRRPPLRRPGRLQPLRPPASSPPSPASGSAWRSRRGPHGVRVLAPTAGLPARGDRARDLERLALPAAGGRSPATYVVLVVPAFLTMVGFAVWARRERAGADPRPWDCARRGFLHPAEVPWLVRFQGRRALRRNAAAVGGAALRAMEDYQRAAIELGYLHHRFLRGTPPRDYAAPGEPAPAAPWSACAART